MSQHRANVRPRYGRLAVLGVSLTVTAVSVVGALVGIPTGSQGSAAAEGAYRQSASTAQSSADPTPRAAPDRDGRPASEPTVSVRSVEGPADTVLPADSGTGKRVVFSQSRQRVWLAGGGEVRRTYPVSGSTLDNLDPGTYTVYSKSRWATGIDDSGSMEYFVRFTQGPTGAAIGFHTIPVKDGERVQTVAQLGTPRSHGCIRQRTPDAIALWNFIPIGGTVVVTA